jgi:hypothetical protein
MPAGHRIDVEHPLYKAFHTEAEAKGLTQEAFSEALFAYVRGVAGKTTPTTAPAAPAPAAEPDFSKMSTREQIHHAIANSPGRTPLR